MKARIDPETLFFYNIAKNNFFARIEEINLEADNLLRKAYGTEGRCLKNLVELLRKESDAFFSQPVDEQPNLYPSFKKTCHMMLENANDKVKYQLKNKQRIVNFLQTVSLIGAILGIIQWGLTNRYALFPLEKNVSKVLEAPKRSLAAMFKP